MSGQPPPLSLVLVTGLSGAGKSSILRALEDLGFETIDNPPLASLEDLAARSERDLAVGVDARSRGFAAEAVLATLRRLKTNPALHVSLVYATAGDEFLLRRYSATRRRHPLAQNGTVADGIAVEHDLTDRLRRAADLVIDTSNLPLPGLRQTIERHFGVAALQPGLSLVSFSYAGGLPPAADMVFDARFLRNPHYVETLRRLTGQHPAVGSFIEDDPDFAVYFAQIFSLITFLLPRFVQEGKKYATIAVGCTGGQHRSVYMIEKLDAQLGEAKWLHDAGWRVTVTHREADKFPTAAPLSTASVKE